MPQVTATYEVKVGWDPLPSTVLRLDVGTFAGTYTIGNPLYTTFAGASDDITADVKSFRILRGREDTLDPMRAGQATIVVKDTTGKYNPENASSPLYGKLLPMRPVRIRGTYGSTKPLYQGYIETIEYSPEAREATISCIDSFVVLDNAEPVIPELGVIRTEDALLALLQYSEIPNAHLITLSGQGDYMPAFSTDGSETALATIQKLLEVNRGDFFVGCDGVFVYFDRDVRWANTTPTAIARSAERLLQPSVDLQRVRNRCSARQTPNGTVQIREDTASKASFGKRDFGSVESAYFFSDDHAGALASYIVWKRKDPTSLAWQMDFTANKADSLMTLALDVELVDVVSIAETAISGNFYVESIEHNVREGGKLHTVNLGLSKRRAGDIGFRIGSSAPSGSTIGGTDVLVYGNF